MVATAVDGTPEIVVNGKTGLTVPAGDVNALAASIAELLRNPQHAAQLGAEGARYVRECFTVERQLRQTEDLYESLWTNKTGRALSERECVAGAK
jgi:glycosyltransferase involved in cell wall biosynthesis